MLKKTVIEYFIQQKENFLLSYEKAIQSTDVNAIHNMRVSVKRISTLLSVLNRNEIKDFRVRECYSPIRTVYKSSGAIRDIQVQEDLLIEYQQQLNFKLIWLNNLIEFQKNKEKNAFFKKSEYFEYGAIKRSFQQVENHIAILSYDEILAYLVSYRDSCEKQFEKFIDVVNPKHNLHKARRAIKRIGYLMEMSGYEAVGFKYTLDEYKRLGNILGNWHDRQVFYKYLNALKNVKKRNFLNLNILIKQVYIDKEELKNEFYGLLKE